MKSLLASLLLITAISHAESIVNSNSPQPSQTLINYGTEQPQWRNKLRQLPAQGKFRIVQLGDSHTAGDYFTEELRQRFQRKWGDGGIGWITPSNPKGQRNASVSYTSDWQTTSSRGNTADFPLGGVITQSSEQGSNLIITPKEHINSRDIQNITILAKPLVNQQLLFVNGQELIANGNNWQSLYTQTRLPLTINSIVTWDIGLINIENQQRGITLSALGINGSQLSHIRNKWRTNWINDLAQTQADLVILAYGTNEAFARDLDITKTEQEWQQTIHQIKAKLPNAGILIIGAPESLKSTVGSCGTRPAYLDAVQVMQQRIAQSEHTLYWSWQNAMGGECSMKNWVNQNLAGKDGVHFSASGYRLAASILADELIHWITSSK